MKIETFLDPSILKFHEDHEALINVAKGSSYNHQCWEGGYKDHILQCLVIAQRLYASFHVPFKFESVVKVLYFHDIEKIWKYSPSSQLPEWFDKDKFPEYLKENYDITFTDEELNAYKYIHGEGDAYQKGKRVMNELAGFCHAVDVLSARTFWDKGDWLDIVAR